MTRRLTLLAVLLLSASAASAQEKRFILSAYGVYAATSTEYEATRTFEAFAEEGSLNALYEGTSGYGGELGFTWRFSRNFGVGAAGTFITRDATAAYTANVPHPLYLNRPRPSEGTIDVDYKETMGHLDFVYLGQAGPLDFTVFAGPSLVSLSAELLIDPTYSQEYPFDTITITNLPAVELSDTGFGFNGGGSLSYRFSDSVAFGVQARYTQASIELLPGAEQAGVDVDAGGLHLGAGFRFSF